MIQQTTNNDRNKTQWTDKWKTKKRVTKTKQYAMMGKLIKGE